MTSTSVPPAFSIPSLPWRCVPSFCPPLLPSGPPFAQAGTVPPPTLPSGPPFAQAGTVPPPTLPPGSQFAHAGASMFPTSCRIVQGGAFPFGSGPVMFASREVGSHGGAGGHPVVRGIPHLSPMSVSPRSMGVPIGGPMNGVPTAVAGGLGMPTVDSAGRALVQDGREVGGSMQVVYDLKHEADVDHRINTTTKLRLESKFGEIPMQDALDALLNESGKLTRQQFGDAMKELASKHNINCKQKIVDALFDLFDRDDNEVVDSLEIVCGVSLLCKGTEEERVKACFDLFDSNKDGYISKDEMSSLLLSVFTVVLTDKIMRKMQNAGVNVTSAEQLAEATVSNAFNKADENKDDKLSYTEFLNWFTAPRDDPDTFSSFPLKELLA